MTETTLCPNQPKSAIVLSADKQSYHKCQFAWLCKNRGCQWVEKQ